MSKAIRERRSRCANLLCEPFERPRIGGAIVQPCKRVPDQRVTQTGEPAGMSCGGGLEAPSHDLDKEDLAEMQKHAFRARLPPPRFSKRELDHLRQPIGLGHG